MKRNPNRPQNERARGIVRDAIKRKDIRVPEKCERCGCPSKLCSDNRRYLHAHHSDYNKPLAIEWICPRCHRSITPIPNGEKNGFAKLTNEKVRIAHNLFKIGLNYTAIGFRLGVSRETISRVINGKSWLAERNNKGE